MRPPPAARQASQYLSRCLDCDHSERVGAAYAYWCGMCASANTHTAPTCKPKEIPDASPRRPQAHTSKTGGQHDRTTACRRGLHHR